MRLYFHLSIRTRVQSTRFYNYSLSHFQSFSLLSFVRRFPLSISHAPWRRTIACHAIASCIYALILLIVPRLYFHSFLSRFYVSVHLLTFRYLYLSLTFSFPFASWNLSRLPSACPGVSRLVGVFVDRIGMGNVNNFTLIVLFNFLNNNNNLFNHSPSDVLHFYCLSLVIN